MVCMLRWLNKLSSVIGCIFLPLYILYLAVVRATFKGESEPRAKGGGTKKNNLNLQNKKKTAMQAPRCMQQRRAINIYVPKIRKAKGRVTGFERKGDPFQLK